MTNYRIHADRLLLGETVEFRPRGNSMTPLIKSGQLVTIAPIKKPLVTGDIVFCRVKGCFYVHLVKNVDGEGRALIGNNHGRTNGGASKVFGVLVSVAD